METFVYALSLANGTASNLSSGGTAITLSLSGGKVVGTAGGVPVFDIVVNSSGVVTLSQYKPIDHGSPTSPAELVTLTNTLVTLTRTITVTDRDGDTATASSSITLSGITFQDDGPSIGTPADATVNEANFSNGSVGNPALLTQTGNLNAVFGGDGGSALVKAQFTQATLAGLPALSSNGTALLYTLSPDGKTITATAGPSGAQVFTIVLNATAAGTGASTGIGNYTFTLKGPLDHGTDATKVLTFPFTVTDADGDTASKTFTVTVLDDKPGGSTGKDSMTMLEDSAGVTISTSADANPTNTTIVGATGSPDGHGGIAYSVAHGTVTVNSNGSITYVPKPDYSNHDHPDAFTYRTANGTDIVQVVVTVTVTPVADRPSLDGSTSGAKPATVALPAVTTPEDTAVALGLKAPVVIDSLDQSTGGGDAVERLGLITLTGIPAGAQLLADDNTLWHLSTGGPITVLLSEDPQHLSGLSGQTLTMTRAQFEALKVLPPAESHANFTVSVSVTSHEVNEAGEALGTNATSTATVAVNVQAVTDPIDLKIDDGTGTSTFVDTSPAAPRVVQMTEDTAFNLASLLQVNLPNDPSGSGYDGNAADDTDGSEARWFVVIGLPEGSIVNGHTVTAGESTGGYRVDIPDNHTEAAPNLPALNIQAPHDFSGMLPGVTVTLWAQDRDADGVGAGANTGTAISDPVYVTLRVAPNAADDVAASNVTTPEDTAVAFLAGVRVTDAGAGTGHQY